MSRAGFSLQPRVWVMCYRVFLLAALLSRSSGESSVHGPPKTVVALAGGDVILPCNFSITASYDFPTVEWSKEGLQPNVVFLYRDGCETPEMKNPAFRYRTSLITKELKNGNISLRISNVQLADAGKYQCMRLWKRAHRDITAVELVVGAVSEPKLSVTSAEDGGVTLECEANCWLPEPQIYFLDNRGNNIPDVDDPKRDQDARGCYTVRQRVTLKEATKRVICRVHQPEINQTRDTETLLPVDGRKSCSLTTIIAVGGTVLLLLVPSCGLAFFLWKRCGKSAEGQKLPVTRQSSDQSTISGSSESKTLLQSVKAVRDGNTEDITVEMLTTEVANLKSKVHEQENTIRQLQNKFQLTAVVCQYDQPQILYSAAASTIGSPPKSANLPQIKRPNPGIARQNSNPVPCRPIQKSHRRHSSPALLNLALHGSSSASTLEKKLGRISCSMSDDLARPGAGTKLQRRSSSANTRSTRLADLSEELELLIA